MNQRHRPQQHIAAPLRAGAAAKRGQQEPVKALNTPPAITRPVGFHVGDMIGPFELQYEIASGAFGNVFAAANKQDGTIVAMKITRDRTAAAYALIHEYIVLTRLRELYPDTDSKPFNRLPGFPRVHWIGTHEQDAFLAMELLGLDLHTLLQRAPGRRFPLKTVLMVGSQMIDCLEQLHASHFLHCDLKPENIVVRSTNLAHVDAQTLCLIDLGLTQRFWDEKTNEHIPYQEYDHLNGTAMYASINAHAYLEFSRRDDLESLMYVLLYLLIGRLPWDHIQDRASHLYEDMFALKRDLRVLPELRDVDEVFFACMHQIRLLHFDETPDYDGLRALLWASAKRNRLLSADELATHQWNWSESAWCTSQQKQHKATSQVAPPSTTAYLAPPPRRMVRKT